MSEEKAVAKPEESMSERFMKKVISEFSNGVGEIALTNFQKRLAQNYFISLDAALKAAEEKRIKSNSTKKNPQYKNDLPIIWQNVDLQALARNVVAYARIGLDPALKNHINMIPFKNNTTQKYDIGFIEGYRGIEIKAKKYGLDVPDAVIIELVYSNDKFKEIKKDSNNNIESYEFEVLNAFDRGEMIGGFYYCVFSSDPAKNRLVVLNKKNIEKRKPQYASAEFWGGEKDVYRDGQKTGEKEKVDGWYDEMCWKTIARAAYGSITIDSQKIDDDYMRLSQQEQLMRDTKITEEISENANTVTIDIKSEPVQEAEIVTTAPEQPKSQQVPPPPAAAQGTMQFEAVPNF